MAKDKYPEAPNRKVGAKRISQEMAQVAAGIADLARVTGVPVERASSQLRPRAVGKVRVPELIR